MPRETIKKVAGMGLLGLKVPEKYGGQSTDWVSVGIAIEELARGDFFTSVLVCPPIIASYISKENEAIKSELQEGNDFGPLMKILDFTRPANGQQVISLAQVSLEETIEYIKQRHAFGQPLAKYEGISFKIAEQATLIEAARLLCYRTLWLPDMGHPHSREAAMCKWLGARTAVTAIHDALLMHGHMGYSEEYFLAQRLRDTIGFEIAEGTAEIMKLVIAREILGKEYMS